MMVHVKEAELYNHAARLAGKVVVITGGGSGIGRETALLFSQYGAKVVVGDINVKGAQATAKSIIDTGGAALATKCDVTSWDDQVAMFQLAKNTFGSIDVVMANAAIGEDRGSIILKQKDGKWQPPNLKIMDVNVQGVIYTTTLALHHFGDNVQKVDPNRLKAIIIMGSIASMSPLYAAPLYTASKYGVLGFHQAIAATCRRKGIRTGCILPWFAATPLTSGTEKLAGGLPLVPVRLIAATCLAVVTNSDADTSGHPWVIQPGDSGIERLDDTELSQGIISKIYEQMKARSRVNESNSSKL